MKKILLSFVCNLAILFAFAKGPHIVNVMVNTESSTIKWVGSKISSSHEGNVNIEKGFLSINHGVLHGGEFSIDMNSITCTDIKSKKKRDYLVGHLKNEDFFNVKTFPRASISIESATKGDGNIYKIVALLTIKGITHPVIFEADVNINGQDYLAKAKIKIDRTKWGIKYGSGSFFDNLGDKMILDEVEFDIFLLSVKK